MRKKIGKFFQKIPADSCMTVEPILHGSLAKFLARVAHILEENSCKNVCRDVTRFNGSLQSLFLMPDIKFEIAFKK